MAKIFSQLSRSSQWPTIFSTPPRPTNGSCSPKRRLILHPNIPTSPTWRHRQRAEEMKVQGHRWKHYWMQIAKEVAQVGKVQKMARKHARSSFVWAAMGPFVLLNTLLPTCETKSAPGQRVTNFNARDADRWEEQSGQRLTTSATTKSCGNGIRPNAKK